MPDVDPNNEDTYHALTVQSTLTDAKKPEAEILRELAECGYDDDASFAIKLALEEAMTNAVRHGNKGDESKHIHVRWAITPQVAVICVRDEGCGFCPDKVPDPTAPDRIALPSGRGIMLINAYMNEVEFRADGCEVRMVKHNPKYSAESGSTDDAS